MIRHRLGGKDLQITHLTKDLYAKNIKNSPNPMIKRQTMQGKLMGKDLNKHFTKEDTWMADRHMNKYPASLIIRGCTMQSQRHITR